MGYFKDTLRGVSWMSGFRLSYRILGIIRLSIIAHLLTPYGLGVFGVATITLALIEILTETGINVFLIQEKEGTDQFINTAWIISIIRGLLIGTLIFIFAPFISLFFNSPESLTLLYLTSLVPIIRGFINPSIVKFQKELQFKKEFIYKLSVYMVDSFAAILGVYFTNSPMGLVYGLLAGSLFEVFYTFIVIDPKPVFVFNKKMANKIIGRGKWVTLFGIFDYLYTQSDNIIIGRFLGVAPLGIYQNAYKISTAPLTEVGDVFFRVTFPIFTKISDDAGRLKRAFIKNTIANALLMTLAGVLIFIFAGPIVNILFGTGWDSAIPVVRLLSILGVVRGVSGSTNSLLVAKEKQKYSAVIMAVSTFGLLLTIIPFIQKYGIIGAGLAAICGATVSLPFTLYFINKTLKS